MTSRFLHAIIGAVNSIPLHLQGFPQIIGLKPGAHKVVCAVTKRIQELQFELSASSPQHSQHPRSADSHARCLAVVPYPTNSGALFVKRGQKPTSPGKRQRQQPSNGRSSPLLQGGYWELPVYIREEVTTFYTDVIIFSRTMALGSPQLKGGRRVRLTTSSATASRLSRTWGTRTTGCTRRHLRGYAITPYGVCKI
jgi:hypothetical protein